MRHITETRDREGNVVREGDTVECVEATAVSHDWYPQQPGEVFTIRDTSGDNGLYLEGNDHCVDSSRFVKVQPCRASTELGADCHPQPATILQDAEQAVYGDRQDDYGHPREDFTRTAILWTGVLQHKLADGEYITPEDIALCMVQVKVSREVNKPKRDNRVDGAGYFLCLDRLETGK